MAARAWAVSRSLLMPAAGPPVENLVQMKTLLHIARREAVLR